MALLAPMAELATTADRRDPRWAAQPAWVRDTNPAAARPPLPIQLRDNIRKSVLKLHRAGVRLLAGTDAPLTPVGLTLHKELEEAVRAGLTPFDALQMATTIPAELLGERADIGSIEVGKLADMVLVDGNPLADIHDARNVRQVIVNGRIYGPEELRLK
jgi:imidazolonepropionase-like amidohydrolase